MDYSAANVQLWNGIIQLGYIAAAILLCNRLRARVELVRQSMMPVAVIAGFMLMLLKNFGLINLDNNFMEFLTYHGIAMGFIAMSIRTVDKAANKNERRALKSGIIIVSTYMVQALTGLAITVALGYTFMPGLFKAAGILLPMGYGQGPGQANNVGTTYQNLGFEGGHSFGLAIASAGYICACIVGVIMVNVIVRKKKANTGSGIKLTDDDLSVGFFQDKNELPVADSVDRLSMQVCMVLVTYFATYLIIRGVTSGLSAVAPGLANTVNTLIWGFNFIVASGVAILLRVILEKGRSMGIFRRQYQNNYLLNRISGFFFDLMIVAGIASINLEELSGLWVPFILVAVAGGVVTWLYLALVCKWAYRGYYYEGLISMYGMLTGTISSGVLLLRELDNDLSSPAANNLVSGSGVGIILGAPVLILVSMAAKSDMMTLVVMGIAACYLAVLMFALHKISFRKKK